MLTEFAPKQEPETQSSLVQIGTFFHPIPLVSSGSLSAAGRDSAVSQNSILSPRKSSMKTAQMTTPRRLTETMKPEVDLRVDPIFSGE